MGDPFDFDPDDTVPARKPDECARCGHPTVTRELCDSCRSEIGCAHVVACPPGKCPVSDGPRWPATFYQFGA